MPSLEVDLDQLVDRIGMADPDEARRQLSGLASDAMTRSRLTSLISRPGTTDALRLLVLDAVAPSATDSDVAAIAAVTIANRPKVTAAALPVIESLGGVEAFFVLRHGFHARADEIAADARSAADRLRPKVDALHALELCLEVGDVDEELVHDRELALALAASAMEVQIACRVHHDARWFARLEAGVAQLDRRLRSSGDAANPYSQLLRDHLYAATLLANLDGAASDVRERAEEQLFRTPDIGAVSQRIEHLPPEAVARYVERSLAQSNRRGSRADRAAYALTLYARLPDLAGARIRSTVVGCLDERDSDVRANAIIALALTDPDAELRARLRGAYATLDADGQSHVAIAAPGLIADTADADALDLAGLGRWVAAATTDDAAHRIGVLVERLRVDPPDPTELAIFADAYDAASAMLGADHREASSRHAARAVAGWVRARGRRVVEAAQTVAACPTFAAAAMAHLEEVLRVVRADQARALVSELIASDGKALIAAATCEAGEAIERATLLPVLAKVIVEDPRGVDVAIETVPRARRRLLAAGLLALANTRAEAERLASSDGEAAIESIRKRQALVLDAVDDARSAGQGNDALVEHLSLLRDAVIGATDGAAVATEASETVRHARMELARRFPEILAAPADGRQIIRPKGDVELDMEAMLKALIELDSRAASPRVGTDADREHHRGDLAVLVDAAVDSGLLETHAEIIARRPSLAETMWGTWAARNPSEAAVRLRTYLTAEDPTDRAHVFAVDALACYVGAAGALDATAEMSEADALSAWKLIRPALQHRLRELAVRQQAAGNRASAAMELLAERLDVPLRAIESLMVGYFRLRELLAGAGWGTVEARLGRRIAANRLDADRHEIVGEIRGDEYVVRSLGVSVGSRVVRRATVEAAAARRWSEEGRG